MSLRTRFRAFAAAAAVLAVSLSACGANPGGGGSQQVGAQVPPAAEAAPEFVKVDAALVSGLAPTVYTDESRSVRAEVPVIATARQMTSAMEVLRDRGLREATWAQATKVDIGYQVVASGPGVLGIMVTPSWTSGAGDTTKPALVWYDAATKQVFSSPILIQEASWAPFTEAVLKSAGRKVDQAKLGQALASEAAPQGNGPMLGFDAKGNLIAQFAAGAVADEPVAVRVKADTVAPFLSPFGQRAAAASKSPSAFDGTAPAGTGQETSTTSAAPTASAAPKPVESKSPGATTSPRASTAPSDAATPTAGQRPSTAVGPDCARITCIALTYDDGPGTDTPKLVDSLVAGKAPATFFQLGQMIEANPDIAKKVASAGNEVASHSYSHPNLAQAGPQRLDKEINGTATILEKEYGRKPMIFRPPYGAHNQQVRDMVRGTGAALIQWDVDTNDWKTRNTGQTVNAVLNGRVPSGAIVLMHDIHPSTVAAAPAIIEGLHAKGVTMVTVSELSLNSPGYQAGKAYCNITSRPQDGFDCAG